MKKAAMVANYFKMATSTLAAIAKTRNMDKGLFSGLTYVNLLAWKQLLQKFSNIMEAGGEGCLTEKENTKKLMVFWILKCRRLLYWFL